MNLNVSDALQLECLKGATVVAGEAGLENIIRSVGVMEVPTFYRGFQQGICY